MKLNVNQKMNMLDRAAEEVLEHGGDIGNACGIQGLLEVMQENGMDDLHAYWKGNADSYNLYEF